MFSFIRNIGSTSNFAVLSLVVLTLLPACGGDDGGGPTTPAAPITVSGNVTKGPINACAVSLHAIATDGTPGAMVGGPWTTDAQGAWSGEIPAGSSGPYMLVATGGSYVDEASSATVQLGSASLMGFSTNGSGQVTPYTQTLALAAIEQLDEGAANPTAAWNTVIASFEDAFGFDPTVTIPALDGSIKSRTYQALLGGISELLDGNAALSGLSGLPTIELVLALAQDLSDGLLNGFDADGDPIGLLDIDAIHPWPALDALGIDALIDAINTYAAATTGLGDIILDGIEWEFEDPIVGTGSGSLSFSGPGATLISQSSFTPLSFAANEGAIAWATVLSSSYSAQVAVGFTPGIASEASIVSVNVQSGGGSYGWSVFDFDVKASVPGVVINGTTVTFTNVVLPAVAGTELPLTINGQLGE